MRVQRLILRLVLVTISSGTVVCSQWSTNPANNLIVGYGVSPEVCSDGSGGCYITYEHNTGYPHQLVLHRLNAFGQSPWRSEVRLRGSHPDQSSARICSDGQSGVIAAYHDFEFIGGTPENPEVIDRLLVQRVDSGGVLLWPISGVRVSVQETNLGDQTVVSDGAGGCIVEWWDTLYERRIQRISSAGERLWSDTGVVFGYSQERTALSFSNLTGAVAGFWMYPSGPGLVQRFSPSGELLWKGGVVVPTGAESVKPDDAGSVFCLGRQYIGFRNHMYLFTYNVQKIDSLGAASWDSSGIVLDTINSSNPPYYGQILESESGKAVVAWSQLVDTTWVIKTQFVSGSGSYMLPASGVIVGGASTEKALWGIAISQSSGPIYVWRDGVNSLGTGIYAQKLDSAGRPSWDSTGVPVSIPSMEYAKVISDGSGGAIVVGPRWSDFSIRAQQISKNGTLGEIFAGLENQETPLPSEFLLNECYPNPFNGGTTISYILPRVAFTTIKVFDILGREIATLVNGVEHRGLHHVEFVGERIPSGLYLVRMRTEGTIERVKKIALIR